MAEQLSLNTAAARRLATTTKSVPQTQGISSRWLLRALPWVEVPGGAYRVNRRLSYAVGDGRVSFTAVGADVRVVPVELCELPSLRGFTGDLEPLAARFTQRAFEAGERLVSYGTPADEVILIAHGKVRKSAAGPYGEEAVLGHLADGDHLGDLTGGAWEFTATALTAVTALAVDRRELERSPEIRAHVEAFAREPRLPSNRAGEAAIEVASGHEGEQSLPGTFVDYDTKPREYELSVAQTVLRVHSRVADLYNEPMDQVEQQLRLTIEALRERQEHELVNNRQFGLLHNADFKQRIHTRGGPPTPYDLDDLLCRRRKTQFFLAHPRAIAAIGREATKCGIYPQSVDVDGHRLSSWRGVPILPCDKIPISRTGTTSILAMRTGEDNQGVIGLHRTGLPDEREPGLNVRFMGVSEKAVSSYLVTAYYSAAVLVPDALGILEDVELGR